MFHCLSLNHDFYDNYPNRDVPRDEFPSNAWQLDADYVGRFLEEGLALVRRVQEGILTEYGFGYDANFNDDVLASKGYNDENRQIYNLNNGTFDERSYMFRLSYLSEDNLPRYNNVAELTKHHQGGWTTTKSWSGLQRRILHSIMTEDTFHFAMGGHSAAAGHG